MAADPATKTGYTFTYVPGLADPGDTAANGGPCGSVVSYAITATPVSFGGTGNRGFFTDQTGVIRAASGVAATLASPPLQ
jgi:hypothetical protein